MYILLHAGRFKDTIIINGVNLYPHDIEVQHTSTPCHSTSRPTAQNLQDCMLAACPSLKPGAVAAVSITDKNGVGAACLRSPNSLKYVDA
jgi:acyl-CoA synthetase (AMP-forming)/AMP-acid ligase II